MLLPSNLSGGGGGEWILLGTLTKTWNGSNASQSSLSFPSNANEIYVVLDFSKTSSSLTFRGVALLEKPLLDISSCAIQTGVWKQSSFMVMLNRAGINNNLTMWSVYGPDGTAFADGSTCELKVYYR